MLVRAELNEKIPYRIKEKFVWIFSVPIMAILKENWKQRITSDKILVMKSATES
jgi:hypothetical protein